MLTNAATDQRLILPEVMLRDYGLHRLCAILFRHRQTVGIVFIAFRVKITSNAALVESSNTICPKRPRAPVDR
ncbi:hypothetical protein CO663_07580 [Rhizobium anhuiense]|nr:hypothetical protein CO663_07580 [Rhizobium anhuiense]